MGFNRGEIGVKATNINVMDRKGGKSIVECRVTNGAVVFLPVGVRGVSLNIMAMR